jgi:3-hydroxyisobutyrate dehydrogenase-like beta-hydroxyacid dehydrogenase
MSDVSVIGCGNMGRALIGTLADAGRAVTIWNRTPEKAEALAGPQVKVADTVEDALEASSATLVSLTSYEASQNLLEGAEEALAGRTVVQLSSGLPDAARDLSRLATEAGAAYVDGSILAYPSHVGTEALVILYSGDQDAFEATRPLLENLGGTAMFTSEDPGGSAVREAAILVPYTTMAVGLFQGAKLCEIEDVSLDWYAEFVQQSFPALIEDALMKAKDPDFATNPDKIEGTVRQVEFYTAELVEYLEDVNLDPGVMEAIHRLYQAGVEEGRGEHDWSCAPELHADYPEPTM